MNDDRNRLKAQHDEVEMEALRDRILAAGGELDFWGILDEDTYETVFGDGQYLHLRGVALTKHDADRLAASASTMSSREWHVRPYRLALINGFPLMAKPWPRSEEFRLDDVIALFLKSSVGGTTTDIQAEG